MYREFQMCSNPLRANALRSLCTDIIRSYVLLDEDTQHRNIIAWRPVVVDVMEAYANFPTEDFNRHIETFYPLVVELLTRDVSTDVRLSMLGVLRRVGEAKLGVPPMAAPSAQPISPGRGYFERRTSMKGAWQ